MERNRRNYLSNYSSPHFKRTGGPRTGKQRSAVSEESFENFRSPDTVYRILCQCNKIGSVIGKGGSIVKALREETQAKITVSDSVPSSDERVITIYSPCDKQTRMHSRNNGDRTKKEYDAMDPHCAAQDALLKVHNRIAGEDIHCSEKGNGEETVVSARLLVSGNTVGCLLGRKGDVIQRLRSETGANIRVLPSDHVAGCGMSDDELVQISGKPAIVKKALYEVSTLLHQSPRKDKPPPTYPSPYATHPPPYPSEGFHLSGTSTRNMPPESPAWLEQNPDAHRLHPTRFQGGYGNEISPSPFRADDFDGGTPPHDWEAPREFTIKILCPAEKIGSVIGKGGSNVRQLEQETGASIHVDDASKVLDERVIRVTAVEALWDQRSQTIDAILHLQNKTCDYSEVGTITIRLLVASNKVGCLLGQGGHVINDMRRRTHADIRVFSKKEEKPICALADEELVQVSGSYGIVKDALLEIASRLRLRCLHEEPGSVRPLPGYGPACSLHAGNILPGSPRRYEHLPGGVREYEPPSYPVPPRATGYLDVDEARFSSVHATAGSRIAEFSGTRRSFHDRYSTAFDFPHLEHFDSPPRNRFAAPATLSGLKDYPPPWGGAYLNNSVSPVPYERSSRWPASYQGKHIQQGSYQNERAQRGSYRY